MGLIYTICCQARLAHIETKTKKFHLFGHLRIEKESESICNGSHLMSFEYSTLKKATNNFNESWKLGVGGYGEVFKVCIVFYITNILYILPLSRCNKMCLLSI